MDALVLVWNLAAGEKVRTLKGHQFPVTGVALDGSDIVSTPVDCLHFRLSSTRFARCACEVNEEGH